MADPRTPFQYNFDLLPHFSFSAVMAATAEEGKCVEWCFAVGLLDSVKLCPACSSPMRLSRRARWRCTTRVLHKSGKEVERGLLTGTFFARAKIPLSSAVRLLYAWCRRDSHRNAAEMANVHEDTVSNWFAFLRSVCSKELLNIDCGVGHLDSSVSDDPSEKAEVQPRACV